MEEENGQGRNNGEHLMSACYSSLGFFKPLIHWKIMLAGVGGGFIEGGRSKPGDSSTKDTSTED